MEEIDVPFRLPPARPFEDVESDRKCRTPDRDHVPAFAERARAGVPEVPGHPITRSR
jgi:hypothetical protein